MICEAASAQRGKRNLNAERFQSPGEKLVNKFQWMLLNGEGKKRRRRRSRRRIKVMVRRGKEDGWGR